MKKILIPVLLLSAAAAAWSTSKATEREADTYTEAVAAIERADSLLGNKKLDKAVRDSIIQDKAYNCAVAAIELVSDERSDYDGALQLARTGLGIAKDPEVVESLHETKGYCYENKAKQAEVKARFEEAVDLYTKSFRPYADAKRPDLHAKALIKLADIYDRLFEIDSIVATLQKAETIARTAGSERTLLDVLVAQKKYAREHHRFQPYLMSSTALDSIYANTTDPLISRDAAADMANTAEASGDMPRAISLYKGILATQEAMEPSDTRNVLLTGTLDKLSELCQETGLYDESIDYARRNLVLKKSGNTKSALGLALTYHRISTVYASVRDSLNAAVYADSIGMVADNTEAEFYRAYMNMLGGISYKQVHEYGKAIEFYRKAMEYPALAPSVNALIGGSLHLLGREKEALGHYKEYARLIGERNGTNSTVYASALRYLANIRAFNSDIEGGCSDYITSITITQDLLRDRLRFLPSGLRKNYLGDLTEALSLMTPFGISSGHTSDYFTTKAYEGLLFTKGLLLASDRSTAEMINQHGTPQDKADYAAIQLIRSRMDALGEYSDMQDSVASLYRTMVTIDNRLASNCTRYGDIGAFTTTGYREIADALEPGETLIDFTDYKTDDGKHKYAAFVIRNGQEHPLLIPVCDGSDIDSLLNENYGLISSMHDEEAGTRLRAICFDPVREHLTEGKNIFVIPSGIYHSISIDALPLNDSTLVGDRYRMIRLSSARVLLDRDKRDIVPSRLSASLYGGIIYDMDTDEMTMASLPVQTDLALAFATRSATQHTDSLSYLPYTLSEVNGINGLLSRHTDATVALTGKKATEASFLSLSGRSPSILHMATHGFYFDPDDPDKARGLKGYTDAMNLSGLVMSGGNAEWRGEPLPPGTLGGLLTAADIALCDLSGTSLVCLSACNTGRGSAATSEGLYGLQRAFKKAGAGTLVMSLWEASEIATNLFMNKFYESLLANGFNKHAAFYDARAAVRVKFPEPYYWAGFVMVD